MPRPQSKTELLQVATGQYEKLQEIILALSKKELETHFDFGNDNTKKEAHWKRDKNLRDILVHLHEWHILLTDWIEANKKGEDKSFLPQQYTWKNYGQINEKIWEKHQSTSLKEAKDMLTCSHKKVLLLIEPFSNEELFTKRYFSWTGTTNLGSYCISASSSHYDWAMKKLKAHKKNVKSNIRKDTK